MSDKTVTVRITGRVQGVGYRAWTRWAARRLGLRGWVRNMPDGAVVARISGPMEEVDELRRKMWQGPPGAAVDNVAPHQPSADETGPDQTEDGPFVILR